MQPFSLIYSYVQNNFNAIKIQQQQKKENQFCKVFAKNIERLA